MPLRERQEVQEMPRDLAAEKPIGLARPPIYVWNAVWLDENLEHFLSTAPAAFIGRGDPTDGAMQLALTAEALDRLDVEALD